MINKNLVSIRGLVIEALPATLFRVRIKDPATNQDQEILAYLAGKMRMHKIKILIGDSVEVVLDPYGGKGRIVKRL
ncbi:MAG: translation initiation factor IF-1 [Patescibacteria group bacterium]